MTTASSPAGTLPVAIAGLGVRLPDRVVTNDELAQSMDTSDEWIRTRTGIRQRHVAAPEEATSDLATGAARAALADAGLRAEDLTAIVVATTSPDRAVAATAPQVAAALSTTVPAFDLNAACSGFVYALRVAAGMVATGDGAVLVIGAETLTRIVDPQDRSVAVKEVELTDDLKSYMELISSAVNYVNQTFSLFEAAEARRPATLVKPIERKG